MALRREKYSVVYAGEDTTSTWTYDLAKFKNGPIKVEIAYHNAPPERKKEKKLNKRCLFEKKGCIFRI